MDIYAFFDKIERRILDHGCANAVIVFPDQDTLQTVTSALADKYKDRPLELQVADLWLWFKIGKLSPGTV